MTWPRGHQYQRSPLSPGVPLEGSDTVLGLRQIDQLRRAEVLKQSLGVPGGGRHAACNSLGTADESLSLTVMLPCRRQAAVRAIQGTLLVPANGRAPPAATTTMARIYVCIQDGLQGAGLQCARAHPDAVGTHGRKPGVFPGALVVQYRQSELPSEQYPYADMLIL